jgi:hypothetical protein
MPQSRITISKPLFVLTSIHIVDGVRSRTQTPRTIKFVNSYEDIHEEVNKVFASQPLDSIRGNSNPP